MGRAEGIRVACLRLDRGIGIISILEEGPELNFEVRVYLHLLSPTSSATASRVTSSWVGSKAAGGQDEVCAGPDGTEGLYEAVPVIT